MKILIYSLSLILSLFLLSFVTSSSDGYKIGDKGSDFSLMSTTGDMVSLSDYEGAKGYVIIFTCNTCPYSKMYEKRIIDLHNRWAHNGFPVIAINPNDPKIQPGDSYDKMKERANEKSFPFPYLLDDDQKVFPLYGATRTPHVFILDEEMIVRYIGAIDDNARSSSAVEVNYIDSAIEAIQNGKDPNPNFTKAIGCTIKFQS